MPNEETRTARHPAETDGRPRMKRLTGAALARVRRRNIHRVIGRIIAGGARTGAESASIDSDADTAAVTVMLTGAECKRQDAGDEAGMRRLVERFTGCTVEVDEPAMGNGTAVRWRLSAPAGETIEDAIRGSNLYDVLRFAEIPIWMNGREIQRVSFPGEPTLAEETDPVSTERYCLYVANDLRNPRPGILAGGCAHAEDALPQVVVYGETARMGMLGIAVAAPDGGPHGAMDGGEMTRIAKLGACARTAERSLKFAAEAAESAAAAGRLPGMPASSLDELRDWGAEIPEVAAMPRLIPWRATPAGADAKRTIEIRYPVRDCPEPAVWLIDATWPATGDRASTENLQRAIDYCAAKGIAAPRFAAAEPSLDGYSAYDALPRVGKVTARKAGAHRVELVIEQAGGNSGWGVERLPRRSVIPTDVALRSSASKGGARSEIRGHEILSDDATAPADLATISGMVARAILGDARGFGDDDGYDEHGEQDRMERIRREAGIVRETARRLWDEDTARRRAVEAVATKTVEKKDLTGGPVTIRLQLTDDGDVTATCVEE